MANRAGTLTVRNDGFVVAQWAAMTGDGDDVGLPVSLGPVAGATYQFIGTNGDDGAFSLQGSNDGTNWFVLTDEEGNAISSKTSPSGGSFRARPIYIRPLQTEGEAAVTSVTCIVVGQRVRA